MRLNVAFHSALALGMLSSTTAFVLPGTRPAIHRRTSPAVRMVQEQGWDNQDFLDALSGGSNAMDEANENYKAQTRYDPDQVGVPPPQNPRGQQKQSAPRAADSPEDDAVDQGGSRFKEMLNAAQDPSRATHHEPPQYTPPPEYTPPPPQQPPPMPANMENLSVEEQARLFREFMAQQQQPQYPQPPPQPARQLPGGVDEQGRKIGRNKDADSIANSSDLYFAQLKRDSTVRTRARYQGDADKANAVFEDESVKEVAEQLRKNPYLTA